MAGAFLDSIRNIKGPYLPYFPLRQYSSAEIVIKSKHISIESSSDPGLRLTNDKAMVSECFA